MIVMGMCNLFTASSGSGSFSIVLEHIIFHCKSTRSVCNPMVRHKLKICHSVWTSDLVMNHKIKNNTICISGKSIDYEAD